MLNPRPPTSCPPTLDPRQGNSPQLAPEANRRTGHTLKREAPLQSPIHRRRELGTGSGQTVRKPQKVKSSRIPRPMPVVGDVGGGCGGPTANPMKNPNTRQNPNTGRNPNQNPNARSNPSQNPKAVSNHNWNSNTGPNHNRNSNVGRTLRTGGNPNIGRNPNAGGNPNIGLGPNARGNRNLDLNRKRLVTEPNSG